MSTTPEGIENVFDGIIHPQRHACDVLLEALGKELAEVNQRRADLNQTIYVLQGIRRRYIDEETP